MGVRDLGPQPPEALFLPIHRLRKARDSRRNLLGNLHRKPFERGGFRRHHGIVGRHTINTGIGPGGGIDKDGVGGDFDEAIARAQRTALTRGRVVAAHPEGDDLIIKLDFEAVARIGNGSAETIDECLPNEETRTIGNRRDFDLGHQRRRGAGAAARIDRRQAAAGKQQAKREQGSPR